METSALLVFSLFLIAEGYVLKDDNKPFEGQQATFYRSQQWSGMSRSANGQQEVFSGAAAAAKSGQVKGGAYSVAAAVGKDCSEENEDNANENKNTGFQKYEQNLQTNQQRNEEEQKPTEFDSAFKNYNKNGYTKFDSQNLQSYQQNRQQRKYDLESNSNNDNYSNGEGQNLRNNENNYNQQKPVRDQSFTNSGAKDFKYQSNDNQDFENGENHYGFTTANKHSTNDQNRDPAHQNNDYQGNGFAQSSSYSIQPENLESESTISQIKGYKNPNQEFIHGHGRFPQQSQNLQSQGYNQNDQANQDNDSNLAQSYKRGDLGYNSKPQQYRRRSHNKPQEDSQNSFRGNNNGQWQQNSNNNSQLAPKDDESDSGEVKSTVGDALKLASEGLQTAQKAGCSTCDKGSFALSNAKSHSGSAVAISIGG